ncbi:adrenodoxin-like [Amphibalanus amphitrite]|uniref:adrenodoxin-like n=1 Tax=Amphibalanus amphitrite TaxID=1232801 RepID=UPI001C8FBD45|nr:adrenodoxin-like [Amphibalanus amphitrite]
MFRLPQVLRTCTQAIGGLRQSILQAPLARPVLPSLSQLQRHLQATPASCTEKVNITFEFPDGTQQKVTVKEGDNLLEAVLDNNVDIDGFGACEGTLACSTCHLILPEAVYEQLSSDISEEEMDMLDLAYGLTETSRLGCACHVTKELFEGVVIKVPEGINDQR